MSYHVSCSEGYVVVQHNSPLMLYLILEVHDVGCVDILIFYSFSKFPKTTPFWSSPFSPFIIFGLMIQFSRKNTSIICSGA